jgi:hypothetical protein
VPKADSCTAAKRLGGLIQMLTNFHQEFTPRSAESFP